MADETHDETTGVDVQVGSFADDVVPDWPELEARAEVLFRQVDIHSKRKRTQGPRYSLVAPLIELTVFLAAGASAYAAWGFEQPAGLVTVAALAGGAGNTISRLLDQLRSGGQGSHETDVTHELVLRLRELLADRQGSSDSPRGES